MGSRPIIKSKRPKLIAAGSDGGLYFSKEKAHIQFIHSGCVLLDCVLGGGWALGRVSNIVGDKSSGKTLLAMEAIANFYMQYPDGIVYYNEAEAAFDTEYAEALGIPFDRVNFIETCTTVEDMCKHIEGIVKAHKAKKKIVPCLYVMDSVDAISDEAERAREISDASYGGSKAKKLSEFFRRVTQDLKIIEMHLMLISQVRDNIGAMFADKHSRSGGKAIDFYASQIVWLAHLKQLKRTVSKIDRVVGVRIKAKNKKNKVGLPFRDCEFEIRFGYGVEDVKASHEFLALVGKTKPPTDPIALRELVVSEWFKIEKSFLPEKKKYT